MREYFPYLSAKHLRWGRRSRLLFLLFLVVAFLVSWKVPQLQNIPANGQPSESIDRKPKYPERIGEKIDYDVMLGKIKIGSAEYHNLKKTKLKDREVYLISFVTRAIRFQDQETIYCDADTFLPLRVERKISQLLKPEYITEVYDQEKFLLTITKKRFREEITHIHKDSPIYNSILLPFFIRNSPDLEINRSFESKHTQKK